LSTESVLVNQIPRGHPKISIFRCSFWQLLLIANIPGKQHYIVHWKMALQTILIPSMHT